jgi:hypothetical protein
VARETLGLPLLPRKIRVRIQERKAPLMIRSPQEDEAVKAHKWMALLFLLPKSNVASLQWLVMGITHVVMCATLVNGWNLWLPSWVSWISMGCSHSWDFLFY